MQLQFLHVSGGLSECHPVADLYTFTSDLTEYLKGCSIALYEKIPVETEMEGKNVYGVCEIKQDGDRYIGHLELKTRYVLPEVPQVNHLIEFPIQ